MDHATIRTNLEFARTPARPLYLDLALPTNVSPPVPVVLWLFGGAWRQGSKADRPLLRMVDDFLLHHGYAIASVEYRLSHEALFPAQLEDCKAAVRWLRAVADQYHLNPHALGAWGWSSGGHLAALLGTTGMRTEFEGSGAHRDQSSQVQAVCTFAAPTDFLQMSQAPGQAWHDLPDSPESRLVGGAIQEHPDRVARANPITYIGPETPPFLILHGAKDTLVPSNQAEVLYAALRDAHCEASLQILPDAGHKIDDLPPAVVESLVQTVATFFDRHLRRHPPP